MVCYPCLYLINVCFPYSGKNNLKVICMCICSLKEIGWDRIFFGMNWYEKLE